MRGKLARVALGAIVLAVGAATSSALAGGSRISLAPVVIFGQQEFGNTVTDEGGAPPNCDTTRGPGRSWWVLPVTAGDHLTLDYEGQTEGDGFIAEVYAIGTNDFNVSGRQPYARTSQANKGELAFTAPSTGSMPVDIFTCDRIGTYNFTTVVRHRVVLALPPISSLRRHGAVNVSAHSPDGGTITDPALHVALQLRTNKHGQWITIGTASVTNSRAAIPYKIPAHLPHGRVAIRAFASGADYFQQASAQNIVRH